MKPEDLNNYLRTVFQELINDGHRKRHLCSLTLGVQSGPQFENFLKGNDFGIKPLQRIIDAFGYDLCLVPVPKGNAEKSAMTQDLAKEFVESCKIALITGLTDEEKIKSSTVPKTGIFANVAETIMNQIDD